MHLVKAGIETLRAVEAVLDEVSHRRQPPGGDDEGPVHIPVE